MKTDRELLELAARSAGIALHSWSEIEQGYRREDGGYFRPLTDDGDALRLAVKLRLIVRCYDGSVIVDGGGIDVEEHDLSNYNAATRRAITRAAAAIGEGE